MTRTLFRENRTLPSAQNRPLWLSYVCTIYFFAVVYSFLSIYDQNAFNVKKLFRFNAVYLSLTTATTIGAADIHPVSFPAKAIEMVQLLVSLAYAVLFFSLIAAEIKDQPANRGDISGSHQ